MAQFTIRVTENVPLTLTPTVTESSDSDCQTTLGVRVEVPSGQSRFIRIVSDDSFGDESTTFTITSTTVVNTSIQGSKSSQVSLNNILSSSYINVSLTSTSSVYYSKGIIREHTGNIC